MAPLPKWPAKSQTLQDASSQRIDSAAGKLQPVPAASPPLSGRGRWLASYVQSHAPDGTKPWLLLLSGSPIIKQ